ncbi:MAG: LysR family transcriptional regulator [Promethearchaeota archaeon]|nr:MAG: LysR family transcriptional regulator [Candidatus Lokiarchaeota archaeon]
MNIEFLRNFISLTKYQSFSELSKDLSISQSTLSHQISQLEKELGGITLIDRSTRKFDITQEGKIFLDYAEKIINLYDSCIQELSKYSKQQIEDITITASTLPGSHILPKYIANFRNEHPNVNFKILINNSQNAIDSLKKGISDFAGIGSFMEEKQDNFDIIKIGEDNLVFICNPNHKLLKSGKDLVNFDDLIKYPFIIREKGSGTRKIIEQLFPRYKQLNITLEMNDNDSIISAVSESDNISILSEIIVKKAEDAGLIKILEVKDYPNIAKRDVFFIKLKDKIIKRLKKRFWEYLEA